MYRSVHQAEDGIGETCRTDLAPSVTSADLVQAHEVVQRVVPHAPAEIISLEAERQRRTARQQTGGGMEGTQQSGQQKSGGEDTGLSGQTKARSIPSKTEVIGIQMDCVFGRIYSL